MTSRWQSLYKSVVLLLLILIAAQLSEVITYLARIANGLGA